MLLSLDGRRVYFDLAGPQNAPTVCFTHSLNADGGMWVEQMVPLLAAGYRVLPLPGPSSAATALSVAGDTQAQGFAFVLGEGRHEWTVWRYHLRDFAPLIFKK